MHFACQKCRACGLTQFPPRYRCPTCGGRVFDHHLLGVLEVSAFTHVAQPRAGATEHYLVEMHHDGLYVLGVAAFEPELKEKVDISKAENGAIKVLRSERGAP